jgi:hypothetical protein
MAGPDIVSPADEPALRDGLKVFFNASGVLLRNRKETKPIPPLTLLSKILETEIRHSGLAAAFKPWTAGRRGELFNSGRDTVQNGRYCCFDLHGLEGEPELTTVIIYMIFSKVYRNIADERLRSVQKRLVLGDAHRYIGDPALTSWIQLLANTDRDWNFMLDLVTQSINDLESNDVLTSLKQAFFFPGQMNIEDSFSKLQMTDYHIERYKKLDPSRHEVLYWSDGGLRRVLRFSAADPYTYWLATTDAEERAMKRRMKERFGNIRAAIEELVRVTEGCQTVKERLSKLQTYFGNEPKTLMKYSS